MNSEGPVHGGEPLGFAHQPGRHAAGQDLRPDFAYEARPGGDFAHHELLDTGWHGDAAPRARGHSPFSGAPSDADEAFLGLAEPATPRDTRPVESGAFVPERFEPEPEAAARSLDDFDQLIASEMAAMRASPVQAPYEEPVPQEYEAHFSGYEVAQPAAVPHAADEARLRILRQPPRGRRALALGGGVAALALVGLFGAYAGLGGGMTAGGEPVLIRADADPVRMAPQEPGGRVIPNQNKAVYERAARGGAQAGPTQQMLITAAEEPLDIDMDDPDSNLPGVMVGVSDVPSMIEVAQAEEPAPVPEALQPRRVRTYDVRPDGTLVPRAEPETVMAPAEGASSAQTFDPSAPMQPSAPLVVGAEPAARAPMAPPAVAPPEAAPAAPVPQPSAAPAEMAATPAEPPAPASGNFFVQISSQPSEALARESMATLSTRYASAIGGRPLAIQSAEIPDRGTFYRVRIAAETREEANAVCQNLQSAGGSCFVTR
ncbi:SPOR domain-containing protein [Aureimonas populi]|uniref:SPOR domain-containing protein n=1 Tax=Aureimonas populi TaxID=1701758 RepID=A0ABW5CF67_9HYPH|nr:SPOR domain-containing protein [Aureimonas populi]